MALQLLLKMTGPSERYVILLYDRSYLNTDVNSDRRQVFTKKGRLVDGLPPTKDALSYSAYFQSYISIRASSCLFIQ